MRALSDFRNVWLLVTLFFGMMLCREVVASQVMATKYISFERVVKESIDVLEVRIKSGYETSTGVLYGAVVTKSHLNKITGDICFLSAPGLKIGTYYVAFPFAVKTENLAAYTGCTDVYALGSITPRAFEIVADVGPQKLLIGDARIILPRLKSISQSSFSAECSDIEPCKDGGYHYSLATYFDMVELVEYIETTLSIRLNVDRDE